MDLPLSPFVRGFQTPKHGAAPEACRDAWDCSHLGPGPIGDGNLLLAIADGATTASGSGFWARILAQDAVLDLEPREDLARWRERLPVLRLQWLDSAQAALTKPLSWLAEAGLERGAYATLLRVRVSGADWWAEGWGDSCLFHLRGGQPILALPYGEPGAFEQDPFMLASVAGHDEGLAAGRFMACGTLEPGDVLVLASDAMACWLLDSGAWEELLLAQAGWFPPEAFTDWVEDLRATRGLKNDDTTLILAEFS